MEKANKRETMSKQFGVCFSRKAVYIISGASRLGIKFSAGDIQATPFNADTDIEELEKTGQVQPFVEYDYIVGLCEIEGITMLILVCKSSEVYTLENLRIYKIEQLHFEAIDKDALHLAEETKSRFREEMQRLSRVFTKYGYYSIGGSISALFPEIFSPIIEDNVSSQPSKEKASGTGKSIETARRPQYSANYHLVKDLEAAGKSKHWVVDVILVEQVH